ncbi:TIGR03086 family protein [Actinomadura sp. KC216]|uniref:TIGR03086 family metal-binding protein n=1 Tax=Actinomadura sp. KC216 TaxID=2530370 RepID=UPI00104602F9|nr:TIGR03086 family metal-binding protein [Actinomadura sp. KC216]TDB87873.1 TIGR03086 family protein [Actinomadura sp. KC216]
MIDLKPACHRMIEILAGVDDARLADPTPCADYSVGDLIDHVDVVADGFTALALRKYSESADREPSAANLAPGWRDVVAEHLRALGAAWDDPAAWEGGTDVGGGLELANDVWGKITLTEIVVHGWDLAKATGRPADMPEEAVRRCFDHVATFVPNAPVPALWGPAVEVPADAPLIDRVVAITGRTP